MSRCRRRRCQTRRLTCDVGCRPSCLDVLVLQQDNTILYCAAGRMEVNGWIRRRGISFTWRVGDVPYSVSSLAFSDVP